MQEITLVDHADYPVVLIDDCDGANAMLDQHSGDRRYSRALVCRDHFTRHDVDSAHRLASGRLSNQQNPAWPLPALTQIKQGEHYLLRDAERPRALSVGFALGGPARRPNG